MDSDAPRALVAQIRQVEERLGRLLASGWRQSRAEAAELQHDADLLAEAGLTEVAARIAAVARARDASEALPAITLATSACRLLRGRLPPGPTPAGWRPLVPGREARPGQPVADQLLPVARLLLAGREVWACAWIPRSQWLLLEPPAALAAGPVPWLAGCLLGRLRWAARCPLGAQWDVPLCTIRDATWTDAPADQPPWLPSFHRALGTRTLTGADEWLTSWSRLRLREIGTADPASYVWLDPAAPAAFGEAVQKSRSGHVDAPASGRVWAIVWTEGTAVMPLAVFVLPAPGHPARLVHLVPGSPESSVPGAPEGTSSR